MGCGMSAPVTQEPKGKQSGGAAAAARSAGSDPVDHSKPPSSSSASTAAHADKRTPSGEDGLAHSMGGARGGLEPAPAAPAAPATLRRPPPALEPPAPAPPPVPKRLVLVLGAPGTGLSEQCTLLCEAFSCAHLVVGRVMRNEVMSESAEGKLVASLMNEGKNLTAGLYSQVYRKAIAALQLEPTDAGTPRATVLLDGFPRSLESYELFEKAVGKPSLVLVLSATDGASRARLHGALDGEALDKRREGYAKRTEPLIAQLEADAAVAVRRIDASGADVDAFAALCGALGWERPAGQPAS